jgi:hypothetical protein
MAQELDIPKPTTAPNWRLVQFLFAYGLIVAVANLIWENAHAPLYTIWIDGTRAGIAIAHCTFGDVLIAGSWLSIAWLIAARDGWPDIHN